jgi:hypothetical protein
MAVAGSEIKPCDAEVTFARPEGGTGYGAFPMLSTLWWNPTIGLRLVDVRSLPVVRCLALLTGLTGCRVLTSGLSDTIGSSVLGDVASADTPTAPADAPPTLDAGEPPGVPGTPDKMGCSDGTREGFRDYTNWPDIAGCAGAFDQPGVVGSPDIQPTCGLLAGDTNSNRAGKSCSAADLCAANWHVCRNGSDVANHSPTGDCESCVPADEPRFFLVASGASSMGICSPDPRAVNDLHGCGSLGQPEAQTCAPLSRRMGFADCLATNGVWNCGGPASSLQEAAVVTKSGTTLGGVLCCRN